jgi:hypothetical protein
MSILRRLLPVLAALVAALILPDVPPGLNVVLSAGLLGIGVLIFTGHRLRGWNAAMAVASGALISMFALRAAEWVLAVDFLAASALGCLVVGDASTWRGIAGSFVRALGFLPGTRDVLMSPFQGTPRPTRSSLGPAARATGLTLGLLVVFGTLFASADAAFAQLTSDLLVPDWDLGLLPVRVVTFLLVAAVAGGYVTVSRKGAVVLTSPWRREKRAVQRAEWAAPLVALDLLFVAFVVIQLSVLFGGRTYVLETAGVSYAEYARQGFFQLIAAGALTLAVTAGAVAWARPEGNDRRLIKVLLGILCGCALIVLWSASKRLGLYEDAYGLTRLRITAHATILWMGAVFAAVALAGATWRASWLPRVVVTVSVVALLAFNLSDPDARIARSNLALSDRTGKLDVSYLSGLSADAVPVLAGRGCILGDPSRELSEERSWLSFNLSVERARDALSTASPVPSGCGP